MHSQILLRSPGGGSAGQGKVRCAAFPAQHGKLGHGKAAQTGASGLQKGLLRRKVRGGSLGPVLIPQSGQQGLFLGGKHMVKKALPSDAFFHAACITQVNADAQNHEITAFSSASRSLGSFPSMTAVSSICRVAPTPGPAGMPASIKSAPFTVSWRMV